ncbi:MAG: gamma subclass chorismate mutase AroQ [Pseudomonadota bacterium]
MKHYRWLMLLWMWGAAASAGAGSSLAALVNERLELMDEVAAYKWVNDRGIEDSEREAVVIARAVEDGLRHGLTPASTRTFFEAQIEAAKSIQRHWFDVWSRSGGPREAPDLDGVVRPELLRLGAAILEAAAEGPGGCRTSALAGGIDVAGLEDGVREELVAAAAGLRRFDSRLDQILETGILRVGTTGDYPPFSHRAEGDDAYRGIDIDLARDLGDALGVEVAFVPTSWPELMADLAAGRFDIGMSGISRTLARQRQAHLSTPYHVGGKTPIARCEEAGRLGSVAAIDRPGVRVVVNPGGTNERFVDERLQQAKKVLHEDNRTIFEVLVTGGADVMITDRVEVALQAAAYPELCATTPETFTYQEKAYLMPRDGPWNAFVDTWLELALNDGTVGRVYDAHGVRHSLPRAR